MSSDPTYTPGTKMTDVAFAELIGASRKTVFDLRKRQILPTPLTLGPALKALYARLSERAAARMGSGDGPLNLEQEKAALAMQQRIGHELKNAILRGQYADIKALEQVLAAASQAVVERFDHLPGRLRTACPSMSQAAIDEVMSVIADARNEWVESTATLFPMESTNDASA